MGRVRWTPDRVALLGTMTDGEVASRLGIKKKAVSAQRARLGIAACVDSARPPRRSSEQRAADALRAGRSVWTEEAVSMLGRVSDYALADSLGVSQAAVVSARRVRGIPPYTPYLGTHSPTSHRAGMGDEIAASQLAAGVSAWTPEHVALLGTMPDAAVAALVGVSKVAVRVARNRRGIAAYATAHKRTPRRVKGLKNAATLLAAGHSAWTPEAVALLGRMPDAKIARRLGISREAVRQARGNRGIAKFELWTDENAAKLGTMSDIDLAAELGISNATVWLERTARGIPAFEIWTAEKVAKLGTMPDRDLAAELGISRHAVNSVRRRRGIPPFDKPRRYR